MMRNVLIFGLLAVAILVLFQLRRWSLLNNGAGEEWWLGALALLFLLIGLGLRKAPEKPTEIESAAPPLPTGGQEILSPRELEVLQLIDRGYSNQEIAEALFISETTVKSHVSNLLAKLDAKRRTHAVRIARQQGILPRP